MQNELKDFVLNNPKLVNMKSVGNNMFVVKYKKKVFYDNLWNDFLEQCRGTIVDSDFNIISYPFTKIYNYGIEAKAPVLPDDMLVTAHRKVNGFMVAVTWHNNKLLISTTGSIDSDYVDMSKELIDIDQYSKICSDHSNMTFMFECIHKNDPHIIPETIGMYYLGHREKVWNSKIKVNNIFSKHFACHFTDTFQCKLSELKDMVKICKHEGFVFYANVDGNLISSKMKSPYYLTSKWVARNPNTDKIMNMQNDIKKNLDEEYYGLIDDIRLNIIEYTAMNEQDRLSWVRRYVESN
jgi:hypothetical protein